MKYGGGDLLPLGKGPVRKSQCCHPGQTLRGKLFMSNTITKHRVEVDTGTRQKGRHTFRPQSINDPLRGLANL